MLHLLQIAFLSLRGLSRMFMLTFLVFVSWMSLATTTADAQMTQVTTCGQIVSGDAELAADLDCTGFTDDEALTIEGTLHLNGHTLTGGPSYAVHCPQGACTIVGPGTIRGGFHAVRALTCTLRDVFIADTTNSGIWCATGRIVRSRFEDTAGYAVDGNDLEVIDTQVMRAAGPGVSAWERLRARRVTVTGSAAGIIIRATQAPSRVMDSRIEGNSGGGIVVPYGLSTLRPAVRVTGTVIADNSGSGIVVNGSVAVRNCQIARNGYGGIFGYPVRVSRSTVIDNCHAHMPEDEICCADIISDEGRTAIRNVTCNTSSEEDWPSCPTHGGCSED